MPYVRHVLLVALSCMAASCDDGIHSRRHFLQHQATTRPCASRMPTADLFTAPPEVIETAKHLVANSDLKNLVQPDPVSAHQTATHWEVYFCYCVYEETHGGQTVIRMQNPSILRVDVSKGDLAATIVPGR